VKNAREMALLPYTKRVATQRGPRGGRGESYEAPPPAPDAAVDQETPDEAPVDEVVVEAVVEATEDAEV
jgi:hypothetical protein